MKRATKAQRADRVPHGDEVGEYYRANTRSFLRFGQGRGTGTIRRAIWAPGVKSRNEAFHLVDAEIARRLGLGERSRARILDLGCGVGGSLRWLAERFDIEGTGVTLSPVQAAIARATLSTDDAHRRLRGSVSIVAGDLHDFGPPALQDAAIAIESFAHVTDAARFFRHAKRFLRSAGLLFVIDDFLANRAGIMSDRDRRVIDDFRRGWRIHTLMSIDQVASVARSEGLDLVEDVDFTPFLKLGRPRDVLIRHVVQALGFLAPSMLEGRPVFSNMLGGDALQRGLRSGVIEHRFAVFRA